MFRNNRRERRGGGVILYAKECIQAYEITLKSEADCEEAIWSSIVTKNSTLTTGVVSRCKIIKCCKGECDIMGDFSHGHIQYNGNY